VGHDDVKRPEEQRCDQQHRGRQTGQQCPAHRRAPAAIGTNLFAQVVAAFVAVIARPVGADGTAISVDRAVVALLEKAHEDPRRKDDRGVGADRLKDVAKFQHNSPGTIRAVPTPSAANGA
jgi:hypothetical protein